MLGQAGQLQQGAGALYGQQGNMYNLGNQARALQGDLTSAGGQNLMNAGGMYNMANQGIGQQGQLTGMGVNALGQAGAMRGQSSQILGNYGTSMGNVGNMYNLGNNMYNTGIQSGLNTYAGGVTGGYNMNMAPIQGIAGVGQTMQGYDQAAITNAIQQQQERERSPWAGLDQYIGGLSASGGYPHTQQGGGSGGLGGILQGGLGLGLGIAGIGSMLGWRPFGGAPQQGPQPGVNGWNPWGAGW